MPDGSFERIIMLSAIFLALFSAWLLIANTGALLPPAPPRHTGSTHDMSEWFVTGHSLSFAGSFWSDPLFWRSLWLSIVTSTISTFFAALIGLPAAYALSRRLIPASGTADVLLSSIIVLPASTIGLCLMIVFQYGPLFRLQQALGFRLAYSVFPGIIMAQAVLATAMGIKAWRTAFDGVDPRCEMVARSLGASSWHSFKTVVLPGAGPGILAGLVLAWTRALAEFGAVLLFCGSFADLPASRFPALLRLLRLHRADVLPVLMWSKIEFGDIEYGTAVAFCMVVISLISIRFIDGGFINSGLNFGDHRE